MQRGRLHWLKVERSHQGSCQRMHAGISHMTTNPCQRRDMNLHSCKGCGENAARMFEGLQWRRGTHEGRGLLWLILLQQRIRHLPDHVACCQCDVRPHVHNHVINPAHPVIIWVLRISYLHVTHSWRVITRLVGHLSTPQCAFFDMLTLGTWHMDAACRPYVWSVLL